MKWQKSSSQQPNARQGSKVQQATRPSIRSNGVSVQNHSNMWLLCQKALLLLHCVQTSVAEDLAEQLPRKNNPTGWLLSSAKRSLRESFGRSGFATASRVRSSTWSWRSHRWSWRTGANPRHSQNVLRQRTFRGEGHMARFPAAHAAILRSDSARPSLDGSCGTLGLEISSTSIGRV